MIEYFVVGIPKPQARPKVFHRTLKSGKSFTTTYSPKTNWYNLVYSKTLEIKNSLKKRLSGALELELKFYMPTPKSISKKKQESLFYVSKRPDLDNLAKTVMDAMNNACIWEDDSQVAKLILTKLYSRNKFRETEEGCNIIIRELENVE